jgi:hypothetical protein
MAALLGRWPVPFGGLDAAVFEMLAGAEPLLHTVFRFARLAARRAVAPRRLQGVQAVAARAAAVGRRLRLERDLWPMPCRGPQAHLVFHRKVFRRRLDVRRLALRRTVTALQREEPHAGRHRG